MAEKGWEKDWGLRAVGMSVMGHPWVSGFLWAKLAGANGGTRFNRMGGKFVQG